MPLEFDAGLYVGGGNLPTQKNFYVRINRQKYSACTAVVFPEHKMESTVQHSAGGRSVLGHSAGVLDANGAGSFKLQIASANLFRLNMQALAPLGVITDVEFDMHSWAEDPLTRVIVYKHSSIGCKLQDIGKDDDILSGNEVFGATFSYKSKRELHGVFSVQVTS
jgi:hypothetical protein